MDVLIIEDEKAAARNLSSLINDIDPSINIIGVLDSVIGSVEWFGTNTQPDLIFMDIHLADGHAFDIFERCSIESPIIFTTAYDEYALKAFKVNSIDYLLKPISERELRDAIEKFSKIHRHKEDINSKSINSLIRTLNTHNYTTHLLVPKDGDKLIPLVVNDVAFFYIENGIVRATTPDLKSHILSHTLDQLTEMIDPSLFFRANRQYIISKSDISHIELWFGSRLSIKLKSATGARIIINKPRVSEFKTWFTGLVYNK